MWIRISDNTKFNSRAEISYAYTDTSFPKEINSANIEYLGIYPFDKSPIPAYSNITHFVEETQPILLNGIYVQQWSIVAYSTEEAAARLIKRRKDIWKEIKSIRDDKIKNGGVLLVDKWYPTTVEAKTQILWVIAMGSSVPTTQRIEQMDGSMANLSYNRANDLLVAAAAQAAAIADYADSLKVLIDASDNPVTVDITTGWPATYIGV